MRDDDLVFIVYRTKSFTTLKATGNNIDAKLSEKEKEIQLLRQRDSVNTDAIANLSDQVMKLMTEVQQLKQRG